MIASNITSFPESLDRLAMLIPRDLERCKLAVKKTEEGQREWRVAAYDLCLHLAAAKAEHPITTEFGQWCADNGFGEDALNSNTRAAAIAMAENPEALRKCLEETDRHSLHTIYKFDFVRLGNVSKSQTQPKKNQQVPKPLKLQLPRNLSERQADEILHRHFDLGEGLFDITRAVINPDAARQSLAVEKIVAIERGRRQGVTEQPEPPPITPEAMPQNMRKRYEAALRKARQELREEVTAEISEAYQGMLERYRQRIVRADRIIASHKGLMERDAFRKIKACLHPDHNTFKFAAEALQIFAELEDVLVKPEQPVVTGPALPATVAELMARRREYRR